MGNLTSSCMNNTQKATAPQQRDSVTAPTLLTGTAQGKKSEMLPPQDEIRIPAQEIARPVLMPATADEMRIPSHEATRPVFNFSTPDPKQNSPPQASSRLLSMADLLAQQDQELARQQTIPVPTAGQPTAGPSPAQLQPWPQHCQGPARSQMEPMQQAQHQAGPVEPVVASHQQQAADAYALQQGLQFVAQQQQHQQSAAPMEPQVAGQPQSQPQPRTRFQEIPNTVPLAPGVERLDPVHVRELLKTGSCVLVDVRGDDRACGAVEGAINVRAIDVVPFKSRVPEMVQSWRNQPLIIFHCQYSAHRAPQCANWYREQAGQNQRVAIMDGGFRGWESSGLPVIQVGGGQQAPTVQAGGQHCTDVHSLHRGPSPQAMQTPPRMPMMAMA